MKKNSNDNNTNNEITKNISEIEKMIQNSSKTKTVTREEYLDITYKYLVFNEDNYTKVEYIDTNDELNEKLSNVFDSNVTWKDKFGEKYFRPNETITR